MICPERGSENSEAESMIEMEMDSLGSLGDRVPFFYVKIIKIGSIINYNELLKTLVYSVLHYLLSTCYLLVACTYLRHCCCWQHGDRIIYKGDRINITPNSLPAPRCAERAICIEVLKIPKPPSPKSTNSLNIQHFNCQ